MLRVVDYWELGRLGVERRRDTSRSRELRGLERRKLCEYTFCRNELGLLGVGSQSLESRPLRISGGQKSSAISLSKQLIAF